MRTLIYSRQVLSVCLALMLQYPISAQPTESTDDGFKFCMSTCISNSCSGPASVVEKNCSRKCSSQKTNATHISVNGIDWCVANPYTPYLE